MASSGGSTNPIRERIDGEILPRLAVDQAFVVVSDDWDVDSGTKASTKASTILPDIDPEGVYKALTVLPAQRPPPAGVSMAAQALLRRALLLMDVPDPLDLLILEGDMRMLHQRSPEEPPAHFLEGEEVEEAESDEDEGGVGSASTSVLPSEVTEGNVATLGLADNGAGAELEFCSDLEPHVPAAGPAKLNKSVHVHKELVHSNVQV